MATTTSRDDLFVPSTSGNAMDHFEASVLGSSFGINDDYDKETMLMAWDLGEIVALDVDGEAVDDDDAPDAFSVAFSCGKKCVSKDGGQTVVDPNSGEPIQFDHRSRMGMLLKRAFWTDEWLSRADPIPAPSYDDQPITPFDLRDYFDEHKYGPNEASSWLDMRFRFRRENVDYGGDIGQKQILVPYELVSVPEAEKTAPTRKKKIRSKSPKRKVAEVMTATDRARVMVQVDEVAAEADDFEKFVVQAMQIEGVVGDAELEEYVSDEKTGCWSLFEETGNDDPGDDD